MESNRKRLGLIKGKLGKLVKSSAIQFGSSSSRAPSIYPSEGFVVNQVMDRPSTIHHLYRHQNHQPIKQKLDPYNPNSTTFSSSSSTNAAVDFIMNQEQVTIPHKPKISFYVPPESTDSENSDSSSSSTTTAATTYYAKTTLDSESVDLKAASYISSVQERFRLERINSERKAQCF